MYVCMYVCIYIYIYIISRRTRGPADGLPPAAGLGVGSAPINIYVSFDNIVLSKLHS